MKLVVLIAGLTGVAGFFLPFYRFGNLEVRGPNMIVGFTSHELGLDERPDRASEINRELRHEHVISLVNFDHEEIHDPPNRVPYFFGCSAVLALIGLIAVLIGRLGFLAALGSLAAGLASLGGFLHVYAWQRDVIREGGERFIAGGAYWLLVSSLIGIAASLVALIWADPGRPPPPPPLPELPQARLLP